MTERDFKTNLIGSELEQVNKGLASSHELWMKVWLGKVSNSGMYGLGLRPSDNRDFSEKTSQELAAFPRAQGCLDCIEGRCKRPADNLGDPTGNNIYWNALSYSMIDAMTGRKK